MIVTRDYDANLSLYFFIEKEYKNKYIDCLIHQYRFLLNMMHIYNWNYLINSKFATSSSLFWPPHMFSLTIYFALIFLKIFVKYGTTITSAISSLLLQFISKTQNSFDIQNMSIIMIRIFNETFDVFPLQFSYKMTSFLLSSFLFFFFFGLIFEFLYSRGILF